MLRGGAGGVKRWVRFRYLQKMRRLLGFEGLNSWPIFFADSPRDTPKYARANDSGREDCPLDARVRKHGGFVRVMDELGW